MASFVVYRGPSALNGAPIRAVLTTKSANRKTGDMAQLWILHDEEAPHEAQKTGADSAVCGDCPFRPANGGGCYVLTFQGPLSVWKATCGKPVALWGALRHLEEREGEKVTLRLGAYGDPAALPIALVRRLVAAVDGRATGYTHQWRKYAGDLRRFVMASVENPRDALIARSQGWRTFRVSPNKATLTGEIECAADSVGITCEQCGLCRGSQLEAKSIMIQVHGRRSGAALRVFSRFE